MFSIYQFQMNFIQGLHEGAKTSFPKSTYIITFIGLFIVVRKIFRILHSLYGLIRKRKNLKKRYGDKSWVFITGSSDGIGKALAFSFAKEGFNIVLSARTLEKLEKVSEELKSTYPEVETKILRADYKRAIDSEYVKDLLDEIVHLDISIAVNNVGLDVLDYYQKLPPGQIVDLLKVNCYPMSLINHYFIPVFLQRKKKTQKQCAIVNVSSIAGMIPIPLHNVYSASKAYVDRLSSTLQYQYPQLDIVTLRPSQVSTPMTFNKQTDIFTITAEQCAEGFLDNLGHEALTYGHWRHKLQGWLYDHVPENIFNFIFLKFIGPDFMKQREEAIKKSK